MSVEDNSLESIAKYLELSLYPATAKQAEQKLRSIENLPGFSINLLHVIDSTNLSTGERLAGSLFFKNLTKRKWFNSDGSDYLLPKEDVFKIKAEIIDIMIKLPQNLQIQIGESITLIAESEFPKNWNTLIDQLISKLSITDFFVNKSILLVCHSIFKKWRSLFRSDELFSEIKLVLEKFTKPFLDLFLELDKLIEINQDNEALLNIYFENLLLLIQIYYDFNCQDIPEFFEDNLNVLMTLIHKYLNYQNPKLINLSEDFEPDILIKLKTSIIELVSLYVSRYADVFDPLIESFITTVWTLINNFVTKQQKFDILVVKALQFLTSIIKFQKFQYIFQNEGSINEIIEKIILPNIYFRESDEEMFEDEPINFIRSDLEGSDFDSRRKSATDFLRELKDLNSELLTATVMKYVNQFLLSNNNDNKDWRNKDTAIYLFSSLAAKGSVTNLGVTSTNVLVDVIKFFTDNIANDLIGSNNSHPILIVDSIKYIFTFRNQLSKDQLLSAIPLLIDHLSRNQNTVVYTYSAITIEKLLSLTSFNETHTPVFNKQDIEPFMNNLITNLFNLILLHDYTPEKLAENEFLIKCIMRVLIISEDLISNRLSIIEQLLKILKITAKNPSNPKFSHYTFESIGLLIKFGILKNNTKKPPTNIADIDIELLNKFIELVIPALLNILSDDVQEFVPYTFQILAYLLEIYPIDLGLPETYKNLIKPLLSPSVWEFRGNIPGITRLLITIIEHDKTNVIFNNQEEITPLLGVFQKLISSKLNDSFGFDLLESILLNIRLQYLQPFINQLSILLLTRLKNSRTEKFVKRFTLFFAIINISSGPNLNLPESFIINFIDSVQANLFQQIFVSFVLPTSNSIINLHDKKIINIGISKLLTNPLFLTNYNNLQLQLIQQLIKNLETYEGINKSLTSNIIQTSLTGNGNVVDVSTTQSDFDIDNSSFGSQFSKLVSINNEAFDPISQLKNNDYPQIKFTILSNIKAVNIEVLNQLSDDFKNSLKSLGI
ncbi:CAS specific exportin for Srp1p required for accurate mitotic chromosome segregation [Scheffersomyces coipomensis]|uniref:CAS specific exportin for Srp1p required for accurate mitotic chromosome segregation n=1 Tax=Scheffersomyces coipomensis TaxID=1788519 RepID=UPI00315DFEA4